MDEPQQKHDHLPLIFPDNFLWGVSTSAHQVEGNNTKSDWWEWELMHQPPEKRSGLACDQYNRYEEDFGIAQNLNLNAYRLSIEWARIEPEEGKFDQEQIEHYIKVLQSLKKKNMQVMLTVWHFTLPLWLSKKGGWENSKAGFYFERFIKMVGPQIKDHVDFWVTLNEPGVYAWGAYSTGMWPPQKKSNYATFGVYWNLAQAHKKAYKAIKTFSNKPIGISNNVQTFHSTHKHSFVEQMGVYFADLIGNHAFYKLTPGTHDFVGLNYYFHHRIDKRKGIIPSIIEAKYEAQDVSDLGWEVYPEGIFDILMDLSTHVPIYITECGIASTNDDRRTRFLISYLQEIYRAIRSGVNVKGFFYWSLLDNFEWAEGFTPRFGLVDVNYQTQERKLRDSAYVYAEIAKYNNIPHSLLRLLGHTVTVDEVLCYQHPGPKALCEHRQ